MAVNALYLDNWIVEAVARPQGAYRLSARYEIEPDHCPKCGSTKKAYKHGPITIDYTDAPVHGKTTTVAVEVMRYRCRDCGGTFMQPLPDMHPKRRMTMRCVEHIEEQGLIRPYAQIAREIGLDEKTVRDVCNEEIERLLGDYQPYAPVVLGIDELHLRNRKRAIFTDVGERRVIDLIEDMDRNSVGRWLHQLPNRSRIQVVTMDMWGPYRDLVRAIMPKAIVITDKWHIQKKANEVLDLLRNRQRREAKGKAKRNPWRARRLIQASRKALSPQRAFVLDGVLKNNSLLSAAWHCKEGFYDIWDAASRADAEACFDAWRMTIPDEVSEFRSIAKTIDGWREEVFAYFDHPFTNAYTEAANGLVKIANRNGRGYSFKAIRARAISMPIRGKLRFTVCQQCLGVIEVPPTHPHVAHFIPKQIIGAHAPPMNLWITCDRCNRFHTESWFKHQRRSTPKSG